MATTELPISLSAIYADGSEILSDGSPVEPGIHLRWSFFPELGFPAGGFNVERRFYSGEFLQPDRTWEVLLRNIHLPDTLPKVYSKLSKINSLSPEPYKNDASQVVQLVQQLRSSGLPMHKVPLTGGNQPKGKLYLLDFILMASMDPVIAKVLGLYFVDGSVLPGSPADYRVQGLWGDVLWPKEEISFNKLTNVDLAPKQFVIGKVLFSSPRHLRLIQVGSDLVLNLKGVQALPLQLIFDHPVAEVEFELAPATETLATQWTARAQSGLTILTSEPRGGLTATLSGRKFIVTSSDNKRFSSLAIHGGPGSTSWMIAKVNYKRFKGNIGNIYTNIVRLCPVTQSIPDPPEQYQNIPARIPKVSAIPVETLRSFDMPAMIGEDGNIVHGKTNIEIFCRLPERSPDIVTALAQPVRMHIQRMNVTGAAFDVLTTAQPTPYALPELVAFWKLNNLNATQRGGALTWKGTAGEVIFRATSEFYVAKIDRPQEKLFLMNPGYLETQSLAVLNNLGSNLFIQLWILPIGVQEAPALIGNNGSQSFRFGLVRRGAGYALRFYINGTGPFDSPGSINPAGGKFSWTKVAVEYNGREVRFYINNDPSGSFRAALGKVRSNPWNRLCIGCDPLLPPPTPSYDFQFRGYIADVQIWRSLFPYPAAKRNQLCFTAGWALHENLVEEKNRTATSLVGNPKYIGDHPQDNTRTSFYFDGNTFLNADRVNLQKHNQSQLTIQLWVKPEPGPSSATIIASILANRYSIALVRHEAGFKISLTINRAFLVFRDAIPAAYWSHLTIGVNRNYAVLYINGLHGGNQNISTGGFNDILNNSFYIGAGTGSGAGNLLNPYKGSMADVQVWNCMPAAPSPALLIDHIRTREDQFKRESQLKKKQQLISDRRTPPDASEDYSSLKIQWSFDGSLRDLKTCLYAAPVGTPAFQRAHPEDSQRKVLVLNGTSCVEVRDRETQFYDFGNQLTLKAWVNPDPTPPVLNPDDPLERERQTMTLISNNRETTFSFGLRSSASTYRLWFNLNGRGFVSVNTIPAGTWSYIGVFYNGREVSFFIRKQPDIERVVFDPETASVAELGIIRENMLKAFRVGAEVNRNTTRLINPFRGKIADVEIWASAPASRSKLLAHPSTLTMPADFIAHHLENGTYQFQAQGVDLYGRKSDWGLADRITVNSRTPPLAPGGTKAGFIPLSGTIAGITKITLPGDPEQKREIIAENMRFDELDINDFGRIYTTLPDGSQRVTRGGKDVEVTRKRPGKSDQVENLEIESIRAEGENLVFTCILPAFARLDTHDTGAAITILYDYKFQFSWSWTGTQHLFSPDVNTFRFYQRLSVRKKNAEGEIITETPSMWDPLVGRSSGGSAPASVAVVHSDVIMQHSSTSPLVLTKVSHAEWELLQGNDPDNPAHRGIGWLPEPAPANTLSLDVYWNESRADKLTVATLESKREALASGYRFERSEGLVFTESQRNTVPLELFYSEARGDYFSAATAKGKQDAIAAGYTRIRTEGFVYSEPQPDTVPLQLFWHSARGDNYVTAAESGIQDAISTGYRFARTEGYILTFNKRRPHALLYRAVLPVMELLVHDEYRIPPQLLSVENFVAGALVAYNQSEDAKTWQHFQVVWHEWSQTLGWTLYFVQNRTGNQEIDEVPGTVPPMPPRLVSARYYPGQRYIATMTLNTPPDFTPVGEGFLTPVATIPYDIGIRTVDNKGIQSDTSHAALVAVDRQRPPRPPKPRVVIDKADYHGKSRVSVSWDHVGDGIMFQLLRSVDSAVITRDLEQRRMKSGYYEGGSRSVEVLLADDPDFEEWLQAKFNPARFNEFSRVTGQWRVALFVMRPPLPMTDGDAKTQWQLATRVWQAWADRFYPALQPSEMAEIAQRRGNEKAFTLINSSPVKETEFTDQVNGTVINAYMYRLRSQSPSLLQSSEWGPVSDPCTAPQTRAPRTPEFTRVEAGDREVTFHWALNHEKDLKEYRLYRATTKEELEDLRWWEDSLPDKRMVVIPDPRIVVKAGNITLPRELTSSNILGVYKMDEFNGEAYPVSGSMQAFNYYRQPAPVTPLSVLQRDTHLRKMADGVEVTVLYRDEQGVLQRFITAHDNYPFTDKGLVGLKDYHYKLVALNLNKSCSIGSKIVMVKALQTMPPDVPQYEVTVRQLGDLLVEVSFVFSEFATDTEILVKKKRKNESMWMNVSQWLPLITTNRVVDTFEYVDGIVYEIHARSSNKLTNENRDYYFLNYSMA